MDGTQLLPAHVGKGSYGAATAMKPASFCPVEDGTRIWSDVPTPGPLPIGFKAWPRMLKKCPGVGLNEAPLRDSTHLVLFSFPYTRSHCEPWAYSPRWCPLLWATIASQSSSSRPTLQDSSPSSSWPTSSNNSSSRTPRNRPWYSMLCPSLAAQLSTESTRSSSSTSARQRFAIHRL